MRPRPAPGSWPSVAWKPSLCCEPVTAASPRSAASPRPEASPRLAVSHLPDVVDHHPSTRPYELMPPFSSRLRRACAAQTAIHARPRSCILHGLLHVSGGRGQASNGTTSAKALHGSWWSTGSGYWDPSPFCHHVWWAASLMSIASHITAWLTSTSRVGLRSVHVYVASLLD